MKRTLCIWLPAWPLQHLVRTRPELKSRPVVLYQQQSRGGQRVTLCSRLAQQLGVRAGMPLAEAAALAGRQDGGSKLRGRPSRADSLVGKPPVAPNVGKPPVAPNVGKPPVASAGLPMHLEPQDPPAERAALVELAQHCQRYSPLYGIERADQPESLLADVTGLGLLFGSEEALARSAQSDFQKLGLTVRVAVADTIGAAWAAAHFDPAARTEPRVVPAGQSLAALESLPVAALRLEDETLDVLARLGLEQVEQLLSIDRSGLLSRLGPHLIERLDQALGAAAEPLEVLHPPVEFSAEWLLEHPTSRRETIDAVLAGLVERVAMMLSQGSYGTLQLICRLRGETGPPAALEVGLFQPSASAAHLLELARMQLERLVLDAPVAAVEVQAARIAPLACRQQELFEDHSLSNPRQMAALVDRLAGRLGRGAVVRPVAEPEAQPELAWREEPLVGPPAGRRKKKQQAASQSLAPRPLDRPLRLHAPPLPVQVVSVVPDGPPLRFQLSGQEYEVSRHWGPERIETGWWRKRGVRRDYYRVESTQGNRFWLFRRLDDNRWFCQGEFE